MDNGYQYDYGKLYQQITIELNTLYTIVPWLLLFIRTILDVGYGNMSITVAIT